MVIFFIGLAMFLVGTVAVIYYQSGFDVAVFSIIPEMIVCLTIISMLKHNKKRIWHYFSGVLFFIYWCIFCIQWGYYAHGGEFISTLALENMNQLYLVVNYKHYMLFFAILITGGILARYIIKTNRKYHSYEKRNWLMFFSINIISVFFIVGQYYNFFGKSILETPIISFISNVGNFYNNYRIGGSVRGYPFIKSWIYHDTLPYERAGEIKNPNIIVIFTEGTSARLLGPYNSKYSDLTPNLNQFAQHSMVVDNYFNHTAATFRGTHGQLASCYVRFGGVEKGGWVGKSGKDSNAASLSSINYQTMPKILNSEYKTIFLSPHSKNDPYTNLLEMLGFQQIEAREDIEEGLSTLGKKPSLYQESVQDQDMYEYLIQTFKNKDTDKPVFIAMYTYDTHTNIDTPENGIKYRSGDNSVLNTIHNMDTGFGKLWSFIQSSEFKDNTIIIFTSDHAHYYDKPYVMLAKQDSDYKSIFVDRIPLLIYDPTHLLPDRYDANDRTSLDLVPTALHLIGKNNIRNSFMGRSLFDSQNDDKYHVAALGTTFYGIENHQVYTQKEMESFYGEKFKNKINKIILFYMCEANNQVFNDN